MIKYVITTSAQNVFWLFPFLFRLSATLFLTVNAE